MAKARTLTVFLLQSSVKKYEDAISEPGLVKYALKAGYDFEGALYVLETSSHPANWVEFVQEGTKERVRARSQSTAAILFVEAKGRIFAFTFGYGYHLLKDEAVEPHFGLRVTLNLVDADRLRSVDARTVESLTIYTRRQTSRSSPLGTFGLDVSQDLLRAVTGEPKDPTLAKRITGKDGLVLNLHVSFDQLGKQCEKLLKAYRQNDYKEHFSWIDRLTTVRDPKILETLDDELVSALKKRSFDRMHLAPPDVVDWDSLHYFRYSKEKDARHEDLEPQEFLDAVGDINDVDDLKTYRVFGYEDGIDEPIESWSAYRCLVFETEKAGKLHVLSGGLWYQIAKDFAEGVARDLSRVPLSSIAMPNAKVADDEDAYNKRTAKTNGFLLLDKKLVKCGGAATSIEICDLLSDKGHLIHVKRHMRSATLSHLIAQGLASATALIGDPIFRKEARKKANGVFEKFFPDKNPDPTKYEITYAIITKHNPRFPRNLPFFSQLTLTRAAENLRRQQLRLAIKQIALV